MNSNLIYDVGMHNGNDSAHYLDRGYSVVAVEADPDLVAAGENRFTKEISEGRMTIVNAAIAAERGQADFWICDELRVWNSFDRAIASRNNLPCHAVTVETLPLRDIFQMHGVPYYLKIDIEGHDHIAVADISPVDAPHFISIEINSVHDFHLLYEKGYRKFKCIQQGLFTAVTSPRVSLDGVARTTLDRIKSTPAANTLRKYYKKLFVTHNAKAKNRPSQSGSTQFDPASSGPFGEDTPGEWLSYESVLHSWLTRHLAYELGYTSNDAGTSTWYDLHAKTST